MLEIRSSNPPVVTAICDLNKSRARHHCSLKLGSKLKYLNNNNPIFETKSTIFQSNITLACDFTFCLFFKKNVLNKKLQYRLTMGSSWRNLWPKQEGEVIII